MEPIETEVIRYIIHSKVEAVEEIKGKKHISGVGPDAIFEEHSKGWFVYLRGSYEAIYVGATKPALAAGDAVEISIQKRKAEWPP